MFFGPHPLRSRVDSARDDPTLSFQSLTSRARGTFFKNFKFIPKWKDKTIKDTSKKKFSSLVLFVFVWLFVCFFFLIDPPTKSKEKSCDRKSIHHLPTPEERTPSNSVKWWRKWCSISRFASSKFLYASLRYNLTFRTNVVFFACVNYSNHGRMERVIIIHVTAAVKGTEDVRPIY